MKWEMHIKMMYNITNHIYLRMYSSIKWQISTMQKLQLRLHQPNTFLHAVQHSQKKKDNQINKYIHMYNSSYILKTDAWSLKYLMFTVTQFQASLSKLQESFVVVVWIFFLLKWLSFVERSRLAIGRQLVTASQLLDQLPHLTATNSCKNNTDTVLYENVKWRGLCFEWVGQVAVPLI